MKSTLIIGLASVIILVSSCTKEEEDYVEPSIDFSINNLINNSANIYDTLDISYNIIGFTVTDEIGVVINDTHCKIIESSDNNLKAVIPVGLELGQANIWLKHLDLKSYYLTFDLGVITTVTGYFPKEGVGGDTIKIMGWGFDNFTSYNSSRRILRVNTLPVKIFYSSDTLLMGKIPQGCGSCKVRLQDYKGTTRIRDGSEIYKVDKEIILGDFKYNFEQYSGNRYPTSFYRPNGIYTIRKTYLRENDMIKEINYPDDDNKFELFRYKNGKIDTILHYNKGKLTGYETFLHHVGGDEIVHNFFDATNKRTDYYVYKFFDGKLVQWDIFWYYDKLKDFYHLYKYEYIRDEDRLVIYKTYYNEDGSQKGDVIDTKGFIDIKNRPFVLNIPGHPNITGQPIAKENIWVYNSVYTSHNYYDKYGFLIKQVDCFLGVSELQGTVTEYGYD